MKIVPTIAIAGVTVGLILSCTRNKPTANRPEAPPSEIKPTETFAQSADNEEDLTSEDNENQPTEANFEQEDGLALSALPAQKSFNPKQIRVEASVRSVIHTDKDNILSGPKGSKVFIPKGAFKDENGNMINAPVRIEWIEATDRKAFVEHQLTTQSGENTLESGGMYALHAFIQAAGQPDKPAQINPANPITVGLPILGSMQDMEFFSAETTATGQLNWNIIPYAGLGSSVYYNNICYYGIDYKYPQDFEALKTLVNAYVIARNWQFSDENQAVNQVISMGKGSEAFARPYTAARLKEMKKERAFLGGNGYEATPLLMTASQYAETQRHLILQNTTEAEPEHGWLKASNKVAQVKFYHSEEVLAYSEWIKALRKHQNGLCGWEHRAVQDLPGLLPQWQNLEKRFDTMQEALTAQATQPQTILCWNVNNRYWTNEAGLRQMDIKVSNPIYAPRVRTFQHKGLILMLFRVTPAVIALQELMTDSEYVARFAKVRPHVKLPKLMNWWASMDWKMQKSPSSRHSEWAMWQLLPQNEKPEWTNSFMMQDKYLMRRSDDLYQASKRKDSIGFYARQAYQTKPFRLARMNELYADVTSLFQYCQKRYHAIENAKAQAEKSENKQPLVFYTLSGTGWYNIDRFLKQPQVLYTITITGNERPELFNVIGANQRLMVSFDRVKSDSVKHRFMFRFPAGMNFYVVAKSGTDKALIKSFKGIHEDVVKARYAKNPKAKPIRLRRQTWEVMKEDEWKQALAQLG